MSHSEPPTRQVLTHCYFCHSEFDMDEDDMYNEEVGEIWSDKLNGSVLAHVDCIPEGTLEGTNPDWKRA